MAKVGRVCCYGNFNTVVVRNLQVGRNSRMNVQKRYVETFAISLIATFLAVYLWGFYIRRGLLADVEAINQNSRVAIMNWFESRLKYGQTGIIRDDGQEIIGIVTEKEFRHDTGYSGSDELGNQER